MPQSISDLTGDSVYLFLSRQCPVLCAVAVATVLGQFGLLAVFWWAAQEQNAKGDFHWGFEPTCGADGSVAPKCELAENQSFIGSFSTLFLVFLTQFPDVIRGVKLLRRLCFGAGAAMIITALFGMYVTMAYVMATQITDTQSLLNAVIILMVNTIDELMFNLVHSAVPDFVEEQKAMIDDASGEVAPEGGDLKKVNGAIVESNPTGEEIYDASL